MSGTLKAFVLQDGGALPTKLTLSGVAVLTSAVSDVVSSVLAVSLAALWVLDVALGTLRSLHEGGVVAFSWPKFLRAWVKIGASFAGMLLLLVGDILLHEIAPLPPEFQPLTTAGLTIMCAGFFGSALASLGYFFPAVERHALETFHKFMPPENRGPRRRSTDTGARHEPRTGDAGP